MKHPGKSRAIGAKVTSVLAALAQIAVAMGSVAGCGSEGSYEPEDRSRPIALECRTVGFPCTWNDVAPEVVERTDVLGEVAGLYGTSGVPLDSVAAFLRQQREVEAVEVIGTGVRFRLEGGRPAWVYPEDELAHHRAPPGGGAGTGRRGPAPDPVLQPAFRPASVGLPGSKAAWAMGGLRPRLPAWLAPASLLAAGAQQSDEHGVAVEEPGTGKRALILSPFEFEFPGTGATLARRARLIRDYREKHGGEVVLHADLVDPFEAGPNPLDPGPSYRSFDGTLLLSGEVVFDDFLHWDEHNLVILASHGTEHRCNAPAPVGGAKAPESPTATTGPMCPLIWAGRAKQESYGSYLGVEVLTFVGTVYAPHPGLTGPEAQDCARRAEARERREDLGGSGELETPGGKPCRVEAGEREKRLVALWTPFFEQQYGQGLNDVIVFLASCRSGINDELPKLLAPRGNRHVAVFGFDTTVVAEDAFDVARAMLDLLDDGYHTETMLEELKRLDRTRHLVGRTLDLGDEAPPARPATIVDAVGGGPTHGRDVVLLVDPATGAELEDGATVRVRGAPGDGRPDTLEVHPEIIGVAEHELLPRIRLHVSIAGETERGGPYPPEEESGEGRFRWTGGVALGRDHTEGEVVDLEVRADLPGGGLSRWIYEDLRLGGFYWIATVSGGRHAGTYSGSDARAVVRGGRVLGITMFSDPGIRPTVQSGVLGSVKAPLVLGASELSGQSAEIVISPVGDNIHEGHAAGVAVGFGSGDIGRTDPRFPPPAAVEIREISEDAVTGSVSGEFWGTTPPEGGAFGNYWDIRATVRIEFRAKALRR